MFGSERGIREARTVMQFSNELNFDAGIAQAVSIAPQHVHDPKIHEGFGEQMIRQASILTEGMVLASSSDFISGRRTSTRLGTHQVVHGVSMP